MVFASENRSVAMMAVTRVAQLDARSGVRKVLVRAVKMDFALVEHLEHQLVGYLAALLVASWVD